MFDAIKIKIKSAKRFFNRGFSVFRKSKDEDRQEESCAGIMKTEEGSSREKFERRLSHNRRFRGAKGIYSPARKEQKAWNLSAFVDGIFSEAGRNERRLARLRKKILKKEFGIAEPAHHDEEKMQDRPSQPDKPLENIFENIYPEHLAQYFHFLRKGRIYKAALALSIILTVLANMFFQNSPYSLGYTYTFTQSSWTGGSTANTASHLTDQNDWDEFGSSSDLTVGANITLAGNNDSIAHTLNADFNSGSPVKDQTIVSGDSVSISPLPTTGDGSDGNLSISSSFNINTQTNGNGGRTCADGISYNVISLTANTATLSATPPDGCFAAGDQVMLMNMQGDGANLDNVGNYEFLEIQSISGDQVTFTENKTKYYGNGASDDTNFGQIGGDSWEVLTNAPLTFGAGASMVYATDNGTGYIFAMGTTAGNRFRAFHVGNQDWTAKDPAEPSAATGDGGSLVYPGSGDFIYSIRGGNTADFFRYSISGDSWTSLSSVPGNVTYGGSATYSSVDNSIYVTGGGNTNNFWAYSLNDASWITNDPADTSGSDIGTISYGGKILYPGSGDFIYAFKGTNSNFGRYSISGDSWSLLQSVPLAVQNGSALSYPGSGDLLYAFRGNSSDDFYTYSITNDNWTTFDPYDTPTTTANGAFMVYPGSGDYIYASRGFTAVFWRYHLPKQRVVVQRVPQYSDVTIQSGGILTASDWDGSKGGVLAFLASGTADVQSGGSIDVSGKGYRGTAVSVSQGESYNKTGTHSLSANLGGGGAYNNYDPFCTVAGSAGGGYGTVGETKNSTIIGGFTYGDIDLNKIYLGSAGGYVGGSSGGDGGGVIYIAAESINSTNGNIVNNGQSPTFDNFNPNGGGSGGSIYLMGNSINLGATSHITASGGSGSSANDGCGGTLTGGNGGVGRIHVKSSNISGSTTPAYASSSLITEYYDSGTFVSGVLDTGQKTSAWGNLTWNATLNGETVSVKARTCDDASCSGEDVSKDWDSACTSITSGSALSSGGCATVGDRYVQYQATLSTTDSLVTPTLDDVSIGYSYYTASGSLVSSAYDTTDATNVMYRTVWNEGSLPSGTDVRFQIRTAPDSAGSPGAWTGWQGPDGTSGTYFTDPAGGEAMPSNFTDYSTGTSDQWFQYQAFLTSDGSATPTLDDVQIQYVVNASPEFQNVSAVQNASTGTVTVSYQIRDVDTETNGVTTSLQYCTANCSTPGSETWTNAVTVSGDVGSIGVTTAYQSKSLTWTPKSDFDGQYNATQKIRIVANDSQPANNLGYGSATFVLDTKNPTAPLITFNRSKDSDQITIGVTEDSTAGMEYALAFPNAAVDGSSDACDFSAPDWQSFTYPSQTVTIVDVNDEVRKTCVLFKDRYGNTSSNLSNFAITPKNPSSAAFKYYDVSNVDIGDYRLFLSWEVPPSTAEGKESDNNGFSQYEVQRCSDVVANPDCTPSSIYTTIVSKLENSLTDTESGAGLDPDLRYCYRYRVKDSNPDPSGDYSKWSNTLCAVPGSGTSSITKNVSIHWHPTADENVPSDQVYTTQATIRWKTVNAADPNEAILADSTVWWRVQGSSEWTESYSISSFVEDHTITIPGRLSPGTTYEYRVTSTTPWGATDTLDGNLPATFTTKLGPVIRNVQTVSVGNTNAAVEWDTEDQNGVPANATSILYYSVALDPNGNLVAPQTGNCSGGYSTHHVCTMSDLTSGYHYYYYVYSVLESDTDAFAADTNGGEFYRFTTTTDTTPPLITPDAGNPLILTDTQAALSFETNERAESWLLFGTASNAGAAFPSNNFDPDNASHNPYEEYISSASPSNLAHTFVFSLDSLLPETTYYYRFVSEDVSSNASAGEEFSFTTLPVQVDQHEPLSSISTPASADEADSADITRGETFAYVSWTTDQVANQSLACSETQGGPYALTTSDLNHYNTSHTLKLISLSPDTQYFCQVTSEDDLVPANSLTSGEFSFMTLKNAAYQHDPLSEISDVEATLVTDTKAVIEFDTDQGALCLIQSGTASGNYTNDVAYEDGYSDLFKFNQHHAIHLNGLIFETKYYYQISCVDNLDTAISSVEYDFTTTEKTYTESGWGAQADTTAPVISSVSVGSITGESVIVSWRTDEAANSFVTYSLDGSEISKMVGNYLDPSLADNFVTSHSVTINDLIPSSKYTFSAVSYDAVGNVGQSSFSSFTTKAPSSLSAVKVVSRSLTEAVITWETGSETTSIVEYGLTTAYGEINESQTMTREHEMIISGLQAGQLYHFRVKGEDEAGNMYASTDNTFQQKMPPQISDFSVTDITEKGAKINFTTNVPTDVLVTYADAEDEENSGVQGVPTYSTKHEVELKNLSAGRIFSLNLRVRDEEGNETDEMFPPFQTAIDENPPQIDQVKTDSALSQSDKVQTIISWLTDEPAKNTLAYREGMGGEEKETIVSSEFTTKNSAVFTVFKPGTVYYFKIRAEDEYGNAATSQEFAFLTPRRQENIIQMIVSNFEDIFQWAKF